MLLLTNVCCNFVYTECIQKLPRMDAAIRCYVAKRALSVRPLDAHQLDRQRDSRAKEAKGKTFFVATQLREIEKSGFVARLYQK